MGGSAADNTVTGEWSQVSVAGSKVDGFQDSAVSPDGVVLTIGWPSCRVSSTMTSGFQPTEHSGTVTKVGGDGVADRLILEIDNTPAQAVYDKWTEGLALDGLEFEDGAANILARSSFYPLAEPLADNYWRVMHPASVALDTGAVSTFAVARVGMPVTRLQCSPDEMVTHMSESADR